MSKIFLEGREYSVHCVAADNEDRIDLAVRMMKMVLDLVVKPVDGENQRAAVRQLFSRYT